MTFRCVIHFVIKLPFFNKSTLQTLNDVSNWNEINIITFKSWILYYVVINNEVQITEGRSMLILFVKYSPKNILPSFVDDSNKSYYD